MDEGKTLIVDYEDRLDGGEVVIENQFLNSLRLYLLGRMAKKLN